MLMDKKTFGDSVSSLPSVGRNNRDGGEGRGRDKDNEGEKQKDRKSHVMHLIMPGCEILV